jgi:magnesium-protoporphyrin O-methyltransferase
MDDGQDDCCFDDWVDHWSRQAKKKDTVAGVTAPLLAALEAAGITGKSILDIGCGIGDLATEAASRGASQAFGIDLSTKAVEEARRLASERGVADRVTFEVGDGAEASLPRADVVVLNRVFCCYPNVDGLLDNSLSAAGTTYAFTTPRSRGPSGAIVKVQTWFDNLWYRVRERKFQGFRTFVHDVGKIDARVQAAGFRPVQTQRRRLVWHMAVYVRTDMA